MNKFVFGRHGAVEVEKRLELVAELLVRVSTMQGLFIAVKRITGECANKPFC